jgi:large subunit ribosomal protein L4
MTISKIINFSIKTLDEQKSKEESITLNLSIPESYNSPIIQDKSNYLVYRALQAQYTNQRQGTTSTKTRAEVRGGGRKPWKQKGTGRARAGSNRSPLWRGGGVTFGPKPKNYNQKINKKEWRLSLRLLLLNKQKSITVIETGNFKFIKTKDILKYMGDLINNPSEKIVIIVPKFEENMTRVTKNLKNIKLLQANCLNIKDILIAKHILIYKESLKIIEETYNNV